MGTKWPLVPVAAPAPAAAGAAGSFGRPQEIEGGVAKSKSDNLKQLRGETQSARLQ
ncbi:hypothetical protein MAP00_006522 [Monascus purpureus]|nr:hypothetical protein MAP00_006522 [Monascus purpureus]